MDAKTFGDFLVKKLNDLSKILEGNLLNSSYEKIEQTHRAAGARDVLNEITSKMDNLLNDFYAAQNSDSANGSN